MPISLVDSTSSLSGITNGFVGTVQKVLKKGAVNTMTANLKSGSNKFKRLSKSSLPVKQKIQSIKQQLNGSNNNRKSEEDDSNNDVVHENDQQNNTMNRDSTNERRNHFQHDDDDRPIKKSENLKRFESDMESSGKVLLHRVIKFKESSTQQEDPNVLLKRKYKPINKLITTPVVATSTALAKKSQAKEEVLDDNILHPPKKILFPSDRIESMMLWKTIRKVGSGLNNIGNTCFMNAVLQCLTYCPPLANFMQTQEHSKTCRAEGFCIFCSLERHINLVLQSNGKSITPKEIAGNLRKFAPGFRLGRQEDSHEFIRFVVEALQKVCLAKHPKGSLNPRETMTTVIGSIFGGYLQSQVKCSVCSYESNTFDPFMDLSVDINQADSLSKALQRFVKAEILDGSNKYKCCKCKKLVKASKRMTIHVAPPVLTVQLKRFSFLGFHGGKINKPVQFDPVLNLTPYMTTSNNDIVYDLYGVLVHAGSSTNSGHYYCYTKSSSGVWHGLNDESVSQVSQSTVLSQRAYILFYSKRVTPNNTPVSSAENSPVVQPIASPNVQIESLALASNNKKRKPQESEEQTQTQVEKKKKSEINDSAPAQVKLQVQSSIIRQWDDKSVDETKQKIIEEQNNIAAKTGQQLKQASRDKDSQFDFKIAKWDHVDDNDLKAQKELMKDESLKELVHKKDEWDEEFDKGRARKLKKKKNINFAENQFNNLSSILQKKKEDQLKYGDQQKQFNGQRSKMNQTNGKGIRANKPINFKRKQTNNIGKQGKPNRK